MSQDTQELERLRAAFAISDAAPDPAACPAPETLWAAVRGELPPRELREVVEHTAVCAACAEDWRLAVEIEKQSAASQTATVPAGRVIQGRFGQLRTWTAAAALAAGLLVAVGLYRAGSFGPQDPGYRGEENTAHSLLAEGQPLPRQAAVLRWSPVPGATSYDVRISAEDLHVIDTAQGQTATEYRVPASALAELPPGARILWQVDAVFPDGTRQQSLTFTNPLR